MVRCHLIVLHHFFFSKLFNLVSLTRDCAIKRTGVIILVRSHAVTKLGNVIHST